MPSEAGDPLGGTGRSKLETITTDVFPEGVVPLDELDSALTILRLSLN